MVARREDEALVQPMVVGSIAFYLGKQATEGKTHKWSIYVRGIDDEDLSYFIKEVKFSLHPSCEQPEVICTEPPYIVTQTGWGEFEAKITISFVDDAESPVHMFHFLRLYPAGGPTTNANLLKKPVVAENYEELVFYKPTQAIYDILTNQENIDNSKKANQNVSPSDLVPYFTKISETESMTAIAKASTFVTQEIDRTTKELTDLHNEIEKLKQQQQAAAATSGPAATAAQTQAGTIKQEQP